MQITLEEYVDYQLKEVMIKLSETYYLIIEELMFRKRIKLEEAEQIVLQRMGVVKNRYVNSAEAKLRAGVNGKVLLRDERLADKIIEDLSK